MDESHLSDSTSTTTNLNETCPLDTSCDHLLHLDSPSFHLNYKTTQLLKILKLNLFLILKTYFSWILPVSHLKTHPALKLNLFLNLKDNWIISTFHQQIFSLNTMTKNCFYYKRRLMHMTISVIRKIMYLKRKVKMNSSSMPPTFATILHYPNS